MYDALDITEADALGLGELAELDLAMARSFAARAQAAEDPDVANGLARSYQRAARSYRQTLALKARLKRDLAQAEQGRDPKTDPRVKARKAEVRQRLRDHLWTEHEPSDAEEHLEDAELFLDLEAGDDRFLTDPVATVVARLCRHLDIDPPKAEPAELEAGPADPPVPKSDTG